MKIKLWHIAAILGGGYLYSQVTKIKNLQYSFKDIKIQNLKGGKLNGYLICIATNPTDVNVTIEYFRGKLFYGSFFLTNMLINQTVLTPGESKVLRIDFSAPLLLLAGQIQAIIESGWFIYQFNVQGTLIYKVGNLPKITQKINVNIPLAEKYDPNKTP